MPITRNRVVCAMTLLFLLLNLGRATEYHVSKTGAGDARFRTLSDRVNEVCTPERGKYLEGYTQSAAVGSGKSRCPTRYCGFAHRMKKKGVAKRHEVDRLLLTLAAAC